jgi:hypothetical protein
MEEAKGYYQDTLDELELYKEILAELNRDDDPESFDEIDNDVRRL